MDRPTGVTILAVLNFLGAAMLVLGGLFFLVGMSMIGAASHQPGAMGALAGMGAIAGVIFLVFAAFAVAVGVGMLKLQNWARITTIVLSCLSILSGVFSVLVSLLHFQIVALIMNVVFLAFYAWIVWYMFQPHVKNAFGTA